MHAMAVALLARTSRRAGASASARDASAAGDSTIREALAIRAVVLPVLANGAIPDAGSLTLVRASEPAWRLFLRMECCAAPVVAALRRHGLLDRLPSGTLAVLRAVESRELQRALSARAQLQQVDRLAHASGMSAIVLKGGAVAGEGTIIDLGDLDIGGSAEVVDALAASLVACGYTARRTTAVSSERPAFAPRPSFRAYGGHLPPLEIAGGLPIELHLADMPRASDATGVPPGLSSADRQNPVAGSAGPPTLALTDMIRPLAGFRSLVRRVGGAALYDMLRHVVVQHPFRRGHIRDLIVLADCIRGCSAEQLAMVRAQCRCDRHGDELVAMLDQSTAVATGAPISDPEPTRRMVARKYAIASGRESWIARAVPRWPGRLAYVPLERDSLRWFELASLVQDVGREHTAYRLQLVRTYAPRLADLLGVVMAAGYRLVVAAAVAGAGPLIRRRVQRLLGDRPVVSPDVPPVART